MEKNKNVGWTKSEKELFDKEIEKWPEELEKISEEINKQNLFYENEEPSFNSIDEFRAYYKTEPLDKFLKEWLK